MWLVAGKPDDTMAQVFLTAPCRRVGVRNQDRFREADGHVCSKPHSEAESFSIMPAHHAKSLLLVVANARHSAWVLGGV
jgi:hypothetical protein